ncbi:MAG TPA: tRNA guanosine(34) transglycosylase Tgt [Candidatus Polarisedimenticolia bacterium]|nr:tRNA guanosine(34) transglycosylase Tgt [Candidatus Polarisedimenticolia bacterium]
MFFQVTGRDPASGARCGLIQTRHGSVLTPAFMPVGTQASVKALDPRDLQELGYRLVLANTYHLSLRPGGGTIAKLGGLHRFMGWEGPILTDSGGFQVFSLAELRHLDDDGVEFASHLDGSRLRLTPELCAEIQRDLGADVVMPLDDCPPFPAPRSRVEESVRRTSAWARRSLEVSAGEGQHRFGIVQGGVHPDLRSRSMSEIAALPFEGFALGGIGVGEPPEMALEVASGVAPLLPAQAPRYAMGIGVPEQMLAMIAEGVDLFDCVLPTRNARNGTLFTSRGRMNIKRREYREDSAPLDPDCACYACRNFPRAYLRHLYTSREPLASRLNTLHNLTYFASLMRQAREAIGMGRFGRMRGELRSAYGGNAAGEPPEN